MIMKKRLLLMAMTGVALAGCVSNEVNEINQEEKLAKIMFETPVMYNHTESRIYAGEITSGERSYPESEDFKVFATEYSGSFGGWEADGNTTLWGSASFTRVRFNPSLQGWEPHDGTNFTTYYWNLGMKAAFAAYSPADTECTNATYGADGLTITNFKVKDAPKDQYDLMFSDRTVDVTHSNQTWHGYSGTPITFNHALTSIRFAIVSNVDAILKGIKVYNVFKNGTFKENITEKDGEGNILPYVLTGTSKNVNPTWDLTGSIKNNYTIYDFNQSGEPTVAFTESPQFVLDIIKNMTGYENYANAKNFLMIPQSFSKTGTGGTLNESEDAYLEVAYEVTDSSDSNHGEHTAKIPLADFFNGEWMLGTRQIYILSLGGSSKIFFAPGVDSWNELDYDAVIQLDNYHNH